MECYGTFWAENLPLEGSPIKAGVNGKKVVCPRFFFGFAGRLLNVRFISRFEPVISSPDSEPKTEPEMTSGLNRSLGIYHPCRSAQPEQPLAFIPLTLIPLTKSTLPPRASALSLYVLRLGFFVVQKIRVNW